jgi:hypothetical protein
VQVVVHGISRSGTSLAMQMLAAGGWPVTGEPPGYDAPEANPCRYGATSTIVAWPIDLPDSFKDRAVKLLWPAVLRWGEAPAVVVLTKRDPFVAGQSQAKQIREMCGDDEPDRAMLQRLALINAEDQARMQDALDEAAVPWLAWPFKQVLAEPQVMTKRLARFLHEHTGRGLDARRAAAAVQEA